MSVLQQAPDQALAPSPAPSPHATDGVDDTRRILTRELLVRAAHARPGEARALEFRALHLNLPVVGEVCDGLGLTAAQRRRVEHHGLNGLHEAVQAWDPCGEEDFADVAAAYVQREIRRRLPGPPLRLVVHHLALAIARA